MDYHNSAPSYLVEFLDYMATIKARSPLTVYNYYTDIKLFLRFLKQQRKLVSAEVPFDKIEIHDIPESVIRSVTLNDLMAFLYFTLRDRQNDTRARSRKAVSLRQFFKYLTDKKQWFTTSPAQNLELPNAKKSLPKYLTLEQANHLLSTTSDIKSWQDARDYCMLILFLNCGIRLSELTGLNVNDYVKSVEPVTNETTASIRVTGKGNKQRIIYLNDACVHALQIYLSMRDELKPVDKAMFLNRRLRRISNRRVEQIVEQKLSLAGLSNMGFTVHKLRHTAATLLYQSGVDVRVLKEVLGHENLNTTQIYTHVVDSQIKQAMAQNPLANSKPIKKVTKDED